MTFPLRYGVCGAECHNVRRKRKKVLKCIDTQDFLDIALNPCHNSFSLHSNPMRKRKRDIVSCLQMEKLKIRQVD